MQIIWDLNRCLVRDIRERLPPPTPPYTTVSSVVRLLEQKGFVDHKAYGRTHEYFPKISKADYRKAKFHRMMSDYFGGSYENVVSFLVKEESLSKEDMQDLLDAIDREEEDSQGGRSGNRGEQ